MSCIDKSDTCVNFVSDIVDEKYPSVYWIYKNIVAVAVFLLSKDSALLRRQPPRR